jgi:hypothetical protein
MDKRKQIATLAAEQAKLEQEATACYQKIEPITKKRSELSAELILEEKLLKDTRWILDYNYVLTVDGSYDDQPGLVETAKIVGVDLFGSSVLETGVTIEVTFESMYITFDDPKLIPSFTRRHGLTINTNGIVQRLHTVKRESAALENLCHLLNLKA